MSMEFLLDILEGRASGPAALATIALLTPLSWIYRIGLRLYMIPYELGIRKKHKLPCRTVSVGNLTFGGTGKTPIVQAICSRLISSGIRAAVLTRGHGRKTRKISLLLPDSSSHADPFAIGDEAAMLSKMQPDLSIAIGKRRELAALELLKQYKPDIFILDDGLQYWQLARDLDIIVMSAEKPFGSGRIMPAGNLREPITGIRRADVIILVGDDSCNAQSVLRKMAPKAEIFHAHRKAVSLRDIKTGEVLETSWLRKRRVCALSAIGSPESFEEIIAELGAEIAITRRFRDHHEYSASELARINQDAEFSGCEAVITTAKDAVRIAAVADARAYIRPTLQSCQAMGWLALDITLDIDEMERLMDIVWPGGQAS